MANSKTTRSLATRVHAVTYVLLVIGGTHFFIDRFRLARHAAINHIH